MKNTTIKVLAVIIGAFFFIQAAAAGQQDSHRIHFGKNVLVIKEGYTSTGPKSVVTFNGKRVKGFGLEQVRLFGTYEMHSGKVVVLHIWPGNPGCNGYFQILHVVKGRLVASKRIGKCHYGWAMLLDDDEEKLVFQFLTYNKVRTWYHFTKGRLIKVCK